MAIAYAVGSFTDCGFTTGTTALTHTVDATATPCLLVLVRLQSGSTSGVTFNGQALTKLGTKTASWGGAAGGPYELWGLSVQVSDQGSHSLVVSLATSTTELDCFAWGYTGTDTSSPFGTVVSTEITSNGSTQDCPAVTIGTTGNWVAGTYYSQGGTTTDVSTQRGHISFDAKMRAIDSNTGFTAGVNAGHIQMSNDNGWGVLGLAVEILQPNAGISVTGATIASGNSVSVPSITTGAVTISGATIASGNQVFAPSITSTQSVTGTTISSGNQVFAPSVAIAGILGITTKNVYPSGTIVMCQRTGTTTNVPLAGTYGGSPTSLEFSWQGSAYAAATTVVLSGGVFSVLLPSLSPGIGTLNLRFANDHLTTASTKLFLGDIFAVWGDSTTGSASSTAATGSPVMWCYDSAADQWFDVVVNGSGPSYWPLLFSELYADQTCPMAYTFKSVGGSHLLPDWEASVGTNYATFKTACLAAGVSAYKATIGQVTLNDTQPAGSATTNQIVAGLLDTATGFAVDLPGAPPTTNWIWSELPIGLWATPALARSDCDQIRQGTLTARDDGYILTGANLTGWDFTNNAGDGEHPASAIDKKECAYRWYAALKASLYSGTTAAPKVSHVSTNGVKDTFIVTFNKALDTTITTAVGGFRVQNGSGTAATITSATVTSSTQVTIVCSAGQSGTPTVSFGSLQDAIGGTLPGIVVSLPDTTNQSTIDVPVEPFFNVAADLTQLVTGTTIATGSVVNNPTIAPGPITVGMPTISTGSLAFKPKFTGTGAAPDSGSNPLSGMSGIITIPFRRTRRGN